jgi:hypothetical protein
VVLAVGARRSGHASAGTRKSSLRSALRARSEAALLVKATRLAPKRLSTGISRRISSDWPLLLSRKTKSPSSTSPRSPCSACVASRKHEETPVLLNVAAIFCAIGAFLPTPLKINLPPAAATASTARAVATNSAPSPRAVSVSALCSMRMQARARVRTDFGWRAI